MRAPSLSLILTLALLVVLSIAVITFESTASDNPPPQGRPLPISPSLAETEVAFLPLSWAPTAAITGSRLVATHSFGGSTWIIAGEANRLYYNAGAELIIADITNPTAPSTVGRWADSDKRQLGNVVVTNAVVYIPHGFLGVEIVDTSDPAQPIKLGNIPIRWLGATTGIYNVEVSGNYAYVAQGEWLRIVDVTTPTLPIDVAVITPTTSYLRDVEVSGNYAYVTAGSNGLVVIDVSLAASPVVVGVLDTPGYAQGIAGQGNHVYISDNYGAVRIIDVSNPYAPAETAVYQPLDFAPASQMVTSGNLLYVQDSYGDELHIVDVSDPSAPSQLGSLPLPSSFDGLYLSGSIAYLGTWDGLAVADVSQPSSPSLLSMIGDMTYAEGIAVAYGGMLVTSQQELWFLRPQAAAVAAALVWTSPMYLGELAVRGNLAYVSEEDDTSGAGYLEILDISSPYHPISRGTAPLSVQGASYVALCETYAYVGSWNGVSAINIADPDSPYETSAVYPSGNVRGLDVDGDYLYAATTAGLRIYDISEPATLSFVGEYTGVSASDVAVTGRYAFITLNSGQQVQIIDVFTPTAPIFLRALPTCGASASITVTSSYAYVTNGCRGVALYDISDPLNGPSYPLTSVEMPYFGRRTVVEGDVVSVADGAGGFIQAQRFDFVSDFIPTSGGVLTSPDGDVTIAVPADTYTNTVYLRYDEEPVMDTGSLRSGGPFFSLTAYYTNTGELAPLPAGKTITITLDYPPSSVRKETLQLYRLDPIGAVWVPISSTVDTGSQQVTARVTLFTGSDTFALLGESYGTYLPLIVR